MLINFKVTVIMNVHNGEEFISEAIQSVINQTYQNWELLIWDNLSTDNITKENLQKYLLLAKLKEELLGEE